MLGSRVVRLRRLDGFLAAGRFHLPGLGALRKQSTLVIGAGVAGIAVLFLSRAFPIWPLVPPVLFLLLSWIALVALIAIAHHVRVTDDLDGFTSALTAALEEVDPTTGRHSLRVAFYAERLARGLGLREGEVREIRLAGLLHDVGKLGQERALLQKPGPLDEEERRRIEAHPVAGAEILGRVPALRPVAVLVRHHHERPDGRGYPARLEGEAIPLGSRVVLVADAFDAMTSDRPYRRGMSSEHAIAELARHAGSQFDSRVVGILSRLHARGELEIHRRRAMALAAQAAI